MPTNPLTATQEAALLAAFSGWLEARAAASPAGQFTTDAQRDRYAAARSRFLLAWGRARINEGIVAFRALGHAVRVDGGRVYVHPLYEIGVPAGGDGP